MNRPSCRARLRPSKVTSSLHLSKIPNRRPLRTYVVLAWFIALRAGGNLALAWGARRLPVDLAAHPLGYLKAMLDPFIVAGIAMLMGSLLTRMALFSVADLSFVLPMTAIGYVISVASGRMFLHENVTPQRWLGAILICLAVALVGSTPQNTTSEEEEEAARCEPVSAA